MSDFDPRIFDDEEAVAWLAGAFAGFLLRKPWKVDDEESTIRENRADVREAIQHALNNPEWVERSLETSLSQSVDLGAAGRAVQDDGLPTLERLVEILDEAEGDGIIGPDYTPQLLADYILTALHDPQEPER